MGFKNYNDGEILINGKNIRTVLSSWQNKIAYVPQKIFMLNQDIYKNISFKNMISNNEKIKIDEILSYINLKNELMSETGKMRNPEEEGKRFSGGQIQRIAIARSLYRKREFLILDETLNALDEENSIKIINDLKKNKNLTILLISHNDIIASQMDRIVNIKKNSVNES